MRPANGCSLPKAVLLRNSFCCLIDSISTMYVQKPIFPAISIYSLFSIYSPFSIVSPFSIFLHFRIFDFFSIFDLFAIFYLFAIFDCFATFDCFAFSIFSYSLYFRRAGEEKVLLEEDVHMCPPSCFLLCPSSSHLTFINLLTFINIIREDFLILLMAHRIPRLHLSMDLYPPILRSLSMALLLHIFSSAPRARP